MGCNSNEVKGWVRGWLSHVLTSSVYWNLLYFSMLLCSGRAGDAPFCCGAPSTLEQFCSACVSEGSFCLVLHRQLGKGVDVLSEFFFHEEVSEFLLFSKGVSWSGSLLLTPE